MSRPLNQSAAQTVLAMLIEAAERGAPCPTNEALAKAVGASSPSAGVHYVKRLQDSGLIRVEAGQRDRRVTIVATGKSTALTSSSPHWTHLRDADDDVTAYCPRDASRELARRCNALRADMRRRGAVDFQGAL